MPGTLFHPRPLDIPETLLLVPWLPIEFRPAGVTTRRVLGAELLRGERWALLTGFLGYPHLLTLLGFIARWREKRLLLVGTAGALTAGVAAPEVVQAAAVAASPPLAAFARRRLPMMPLAAAPWPAVPVVTVDWPGRETGAWLASQRRAGRAAVEMELFPLRALYGRPFSALLVYSDRVAPPAIQPFAAAAVRGELGRAISWLTRYANETTSHPDP